MDNWIGIIDCRVDSSLENDFLTLNLWGRAVYEYPLEELLKCGFKSYVVLTDSEQIKKNVELTYGSKVLVTDSFDYKKDTNLKYLLVSGRAPLIRSETLLKAVNSYRGGGGGGPEVDYIS